MRGGAPLLALLLAAACGDESMFVNPFPVDAVTLPDARDCGGDTDGDGRPDDVEGCALDRDSDHDGMLDYQDTDSDDDRMLDGMEDPDGDGRVEPGESDPTSGDSDGDGYPDPVEWAFESNPLDPTNIPDTSQPILYLPFGGGSQTYFVPVSAPRGSAPVEVHVVVGRDENHFVQDIEPARLRLVAGDTIWFTALLDNDTVGWGELYVHRLELRAVTAAGTPFEEVYQDQTVFIYTE